MEALNEVEDRIEGLVEGRGSCRCEEERYGLYGGVGCEVQ